MAVLKYTTETDGWFGEYQENDVVYRTTTSWRDWEEAFTAVARGDVEWIEFRPEQNPNPAAIGLQEQPQ